MSHLRCDGAALCWSASDARESVPAALCLGATTLSQDLDYWTATLLLGMIAQRRGIGAGTFERDAKLWARRRAYSIAARFMRKRWEAAEAASHRPDLRCYGIVTLLAEQQEPFPDTEMTW